jgi:hypothetical protein
MYLNPMADLPTPRKNGFPHPNSLGIRGRICQILAAGKQNIVTAHLPKAGAP